MSHDICEQNVIKGVLLKSSSGICREEVAVYSDAVVEPHLHCVAGVEY